MVITHIFKLLIPCKVRIKEREYRPFRKIRDGYPRYIVSLDRLRDQQEGVHHINAIDLFLGQEKI